ncbi:hypothetical protein GXW83_33150 [Streptacidiphilus sp. PB12-B1b]|uniref:DUF6928 family protein n=1 Tax=Streptacidiphilus sp. PB12-B1b TaxID=2705012 RepID=UPI0015F7B3EF|nr:hypothetical protein [Streptacidiphilus sp. PB12-B1b]QMU79831.1 hypothetical protein GXW83_33150 [Streptacidiphilus sp. PB12-B1b]
MGAKTGLLIYSHGAAADALRRATTMDARRTAALLARVHPGCEIQSADGNTLGDGTYPPDGVSYLAAFEDAEVICDRQWMDYLPSELPAHLVEASAGRRLVLHAMHSVVDALTFAVWEDGRLIRSLSLSPDSGIMENIGTPYAFEAPYWAGQHPVDPDPDWEDEEPYPLPFHPLELGEDALRTLAGFILEGQPHPDDVDPYTIPLNGYRVTAPHAPDPALARAALERAVKSMGPPRILRFNPDGSITTSAGA